MLAERVDGGGGRPPGTQTMKGSRGAHRHHRPRARRRQPVLLLSTGRLMRGTTTAERGVVTGLGRHAGGI